MKKTIWQRHQTKKNLSLWALVLFFSMTLLQVSPAFAARSCAQVHTDLTFIQKTLNVGASAAKNIWSNVTYMEMPTYMSHPIYKKISEKLPPSQAKAVQKFLYYTSNGARKVYNSLGEYGLGAPLPAIETRNTKRTTWSDVKDLFKDHQLFKAFSIGTNLGAKKAYHAVVVTGALLFSVHTAGNVAEMTLSQSVHLRSQQSIAEVIPLRDDQIQILNETVPFPHMAIRIGNMVYSHGTETLTQTPADFYMNEQKLNRPDPNANSALKVASKLQRSVDSVVLNLDKATVLKIRDQLLKDTNKNYKNETFVNSCSSMVARVLKEEGVDISPAFLDASPSLMFSNLALEAIAGRKNSQGQPLVNAIYDIHDENDKSDKTFRNFMIREIEGAVQLNTWALPSRVAKRVKLSSDNPQLDNLYYDNPDLPKALADVKDQAQQDLHMIQDYDLYRLEKQQLKENPKATAADYTALKKKYMPAFDQYLQQYQQELQSPSISYTEYHLTQFKIEFLKTEIAD